MPFNIITASKVTAQNTPTPPELYIPLWWYSGATASTTATSSGSSFLQRGSTSMGASSTTAAKLHTLNASWPSTVKFALEATIYNSSGGSNTTYAALWDITAGSIVSGTQISTFLTTATVGRSGQVALVPGHQYGVTVWTNGSSTAYLTDASLIVYPPPGTTNKSTFFDALRMSLTRTLGMPTELYIPLWVYSSGTVGSTATSAGSALLLKGSTSTGTSSNTAAKLHTLNSSWPATQKFAFEASIYAQSGGTAYAALWDITSGAMVSGSQISTTSTTATLLRSGQITLTPGHVYGVTVWSSSSSYTAYLTKAHLIALLS